MSEKKLETRRVIPLSDPYLREKCSMITTAHPISKGRYEFKFVHDEFDYIGEDGKTLECPMGFCLILMPDEEDLKELLRTNEHYIQTHEKNVAKATKI
jgi:glutamate/tyrosine decarboxylase-like PLP-dependent enzyme